MKIKLHINKNGDIYYSKRDDNDEIIYSFSPKFEDIWTQDDHELYNQNDDLTGSVETAFELIKPVLQQYKNQIKSENRHRGATKKRIEKSNRIRKTQEIIEEILQQIRVKL